MHQSYVPHLGKYWWKYYGFVSLRTMAAELCCSHYQILDVKNTSQSLSFLICKIKVSKAPVLPHKDEVRIKWHNGWYLLQRRPLITIS